MSKLLALEPIILCKKQKKKKTIEMLNLVA